MSDKEHYHTMIKRCSWRIVEGLLAGEKMEEIMHAIYPMILAWQKEHGIVKK